MFTQGVWPSSPVQVGAQSSGTTVRFFDAAQGRPIGEPFLHSLEIKEIQLSQVRGVAALPHELCMQLSQGATCPQSGCASSRAFHAAKTLPRHRLNLLCVKSR